jgi:site-specific recombinase XerD
LVNREKLKEENSPTTLKTFNIPSLSNLKPLVKKREYTISRDLETGNFFADLKEGKLGKLKDQIFCQVALPNVRNVSTEFVVKVASDVVEALSPKSPKLAEFVLSHSTTMTMASSINSPRTLEGYSYWLERFSRWAKTDPENLFNEAKARNVDYVNETIHDFLTFLRRSELANGTVRNAFKGIKAFYQSNHIKGVELLQQMQLRRSIKFDDEAVVQEDLVRLWKLADLREKVAISMLSTGGFRPYTFVKLKYRHVKEDFEQGRTPVHIHVEAGLNKGEYTAYDTFIGSEATETLRMYFDVRRKGTSKTPPEAIVDESPIFRNEFSAAKCLRKGETPLGITEDRLGDIVRTLFEKAGIICKAQKQRRYKIRPYGFRKFFKTQLLACGVNNNYIEYMMGHARSTYDKTSVDVLRSQYASADLRIIPRPSLDDQFYSLMEDFIRSHGKDPNAVAKELSKRFRTEPHMNAESERKELIRDSQRIGQRFLPETAEGRAIHQNGEN